MQFMNHLQSQGKNSSYRNFPVIELNSIHSIECIPSNVLLKCPNQPISISLSNCVEFNVAKSRKKYKRIQHICQLHIHYNLQCLTSMLIIDQKLVFLSFLTLMLGTAMHSHPESLVLLVTTPRLLLCSCSQNT